MTTDQRVSLNTFARDLADLSEDLHYTLGDTPITGEITAVYVDENTDSHYGVPRYSTAYEVTVYEDYVPRWTLATHKRSKAVAAARAIATAFDARLELR